MGRSDKGVAGSRGERIGQKADDLYFCEVLGIYIRPAGKTAGVDAGLSSLDSRESVCNAGG